MFPCGREDTKRGGACASATLCRREGWRALLVPAGGGDIELSPPGTPNLSTATGRGFAELLLTRTPLDPLVARSLREAVPRSQGRCERVFGPVGSARTLLCAVLCRVLAQPATSGQASVI